jgi:hypothetical protein
MCTTHSGGVDTGAEIARHMGFNYLFACEVVSKPRNPSYHYIICIKVAYSVDMVTMK